MSSINPHRDLTVVGLGEALFDCFGDQIILGGAPVNFAVHAHQLLSGVGGRGVVVSRVGADTLGNQLRDDLTSKGLSCDFISKDANYPTGTVQVTLDCDGEPEYEITEGFAWDQLTLDDDTKRLAGECHAVCFGTLAQRSLSSRNAIQSFLEFAPQAIRVFDLNLRQNFYDAQLVDDGLRLANVVKLNEEELRVVGQLLQLEAAATEEWELLPYLLLKAYDLELLALTRGSRSTLLYTADQRIEGTPCSYSPDDDADSVGAGDGSCAALTCGLLLGLPRSQILALSNQVGAYVASRPGATPKLPDEITGSLAGLRMPDISSRS